MSGIIEIERRKMAQYLGDLVENIAIDYILANHKSLIKKVYHDQSDLNSIQVMRTDPHAHNGHGMGEITGKKGSRKIHGWNGDLVLVFNDKEHGKRAIIFEIKFGKVYLSRSQHEFFKRASVEDPNNFMEKLNGLKIYVLNCHSLDLGNGKLSFRMYEYMHPNLKEYYRPVKTKPMPKATQKKKAKSIKKRSAGKVRSVMKINHKSSKLRKKYRKMKKSGAIWGWDGSDE